MTILICDAFDAGLPRRLERFGEVSDDPRDLARAEVVLVRSKTKVTRAFLEKAPGLRLVIRGGVGMDNVDLEACAERGVVARNTPEASTTAVAELAMALLIAVPSRLVQAHLGMAQGRWEKATLARTELGGKTLGLLGLGRIGSEVARRARAFEMTVLAWRRTAERSDLAAVVQSPLDLYRRADYLSLHLPLGAETRRIVDAGALEAMKDGVVIVNTARAELVDGEALAAALRAGKVGGYATDVWSADPPPPDDPLREAPNVLMTPHIGGSTRENMQRIGDLVVGLLEDEVRRSA